MPCGGSAAESDVISTQLSEFSSHCEFSQEFSPSLQVTLANDSAIGKSMIAVWQA